MASCKGPAGALAPMPRGCHLPVLVVLLVLPEWLSSVPDTHKFEGIKFIVLDLRFYSVPVKSPWYKGHIVSV
jgi:hypothetical protein